MTVFDEILVCSRNGEMSDKVDPTVQRVMTDARASLELVEATESFERRSEGRDEATHSQTDQKESQLSLRGISRDEDLTYLVFTSVDLYIPIRSENV